MSLSPLEHYHAMTPEQRAAHLATLDLDDLQRLISKDWRVTARPEQLMPWHEDWRWILVRAGRFYGKLLDVETPIPTPGAFVRLGDIKVGDRVLDERGDPCTVLAVHDDYPERAWRLRFSDSTEITAGGEHLWVTWTGRDRKSWNRSPDRTGMLPEDWPTWRKLDQWGRPNGVGPTVRTTDEIVATLDQRHSIPMTRPLRLPHVDLPIDPYVLGLWLGDGSKASGEITSHDDDAAYYMSRIPTMRLARRRDDSQPVGTYQIDARPLQRDPATGRMLANGSMHSRLRSLDLLHNKHVPDLYLWASAGQRLRLLRGLMDSDGSVSTGGHVEFCNTNERLTDAVLFLARSLGEKPRICKGVATLNGVEIGPKWRVLWTPRFAVPFALPRKAARVRPPGRWGGKQEQRVIVSADPVPLRPMRCLTVDSPNHLFLCGEQMVPTHNTRAGAEATRERVEWIASQMGGAPFQYGLVSRRLKDVRNVMMEGPSGLRSIIPPSLLIGGSWTRSFNRGAVELKLTNGAEIRGFSSEAPDDITGSGLSGAWVDEIASLRDVRVGRYQMGTFYHLDAALREGPDPRGILTGTPRNNRLMRELNADPKVRIVQGATHDNLRNAPASYREFVAQYEGTRLGRQELYGELLADAGSMFARADLIDEDRLLDSPPTDAHLLRERAWDLASTQPGDNNPDPDWTVGAKMSLDPRTRIWTIEHVARFRVRPGERDDLLRSTAVADGLRYQHVERVGSWGNDLMDSLGRHLDGVCRLKGLPATGSKVERAQHLAAAAEQGRLRIVRGPWLDALVDEFEEFPDGSHDDIVDACAMAMRAIGERRELPDPAAGQAAGQRVPTRTPLPRSGARVTSSR